MISKLSTRELFFESFKELIEIKDLDSISVNDIVSNCGMSRSTFYRLFSDKFDLLSQYYQEQIKTIRNSLNENNDLDTMQCQFNNYIYDNIDYFCKISRYDGQNNIFEIIYEYCVNMHIEQAKKYYKNEEIPQELLLAIYYHASGGVAILKKVTLEKELKLSKEEYTSYYKNCMPTVLKKIYE